MLEEATGVSKETLEAPATLGELKAQVLQQYPALQKLTFTMAVNHAMVDDATALNEGDEVAFLPPFAGG